MSRTPDQIAADRARYEEHQRKGLQGAPRALPGPSAIPTAPIADPIHVETIPGGWYWSTAMEAGESLRIAQDHGPSAIAMLAWSAIDPSERLNLPDTIKVQWTTAIAKGRVLFSDMGRVLLSVTEAASSAHDGLVGGSTAASNSQKYGGDHRNSRDNFILAAGKLGLDRRDIPSALNLFAPVRVDADGKFTWREELRVVGDYVELRAEMDLLLALSNCPHPLDPDAVYAPNPVTVTRFRAPIAEDDLCRTATAEAARGFENNASHLAGGH
ncbi:urea amidolyase associated protein UAAP1 [Devosia beringensis]|uniref:urea amidolyase associated protein UAAP1 n=1 Tax=Devosia beringensis TaxID=2657486 RepID=UPI00186BAB94|nr:urea amidolyase associated protein UAAP1 [Devosia beringensis]